MMKQIPFGKPIIGKEEKDAVCAVMDSGIMVHGPKIKEFELAFAKFTNAPHAVGLASCTAALHLFYFHLGLKPKDEVIVPTQTHVATAHSVELAGGKPVFVDSDSSTGNIDISLIESAITPRTRAISLVHYLGMPVNMDAVMSIARKHGLPVVEDCALAIGTKYRGIHAGLHGNVGCFSFYPVKHMTTAEGGMLITRDENIAKAIELKRAFGVDRHMGERSIPGMYEVTELGFNYRMSELEAAMGVCQINRVSGFLRIRHSNYDCLTRQLIQIPEISLLKSSHDEYESSCYCHCILLNGQLAAKREQLMKALKNCGVGTSIYYPHPVPLHVYYRNKYGYRKGQFPNAERISDTGIALPVGPHLDEEDMIYIGKSLKESIMEVNKP